MRILITILFVVLLISPVKGYTYNLPYQTLDGNEHNLQDYQDQYILFEIMTTWCDVCKSEIEELRTVYSSIKEEIPFLSIAADLETDTLPKLSEYTRDYNIDWVMALDYQGVYKSTFNIANYPVIVFLDPSGNLLAKWTGFTPSLDILNEINKYVPIEYDTEQDKSDLIRNLIQNSLLLPFALMSVVFIVPYLIYHIIRKVKLTKSITLEETGGNINGN